MKRALVAIAALVLVAVPSAFAASPQIDARVDPANPRFGDSFGYVVTATVDGSLVDSARIVERRRTVHAARADGREAIGRGRRRPHHRDGDDRLPLRRLPRGAPGSSRRASARPRLGRRRGCRRAPRRGRRSGRASAAAAVKASEPAFRRPDEPSRPDVPRLALGRRERCSRSSASASSPSARSCSRLRCGGRGPIARRAVDVDQRERAVRLLRESATRDADDRRRAASLASRVVGEPELARTRGGRRLVAPGARAARCDDARRPRRACRRRRGVAVSSTSIPLGDGAAFERRATARPAAAACASPPSRSRPWSRS